MSTEVKTLLSSLLLHLLCVGGALAFTAVSPGQQTPVPVDFTITQGERSETREMSSDAAKYRRVASVSPLSQKQIPAAAKQPVQTPAAQAAPVPEKLALSPNPDAATASIATRQATLPATQGEATAAATGKAGSAGSGTGESIAESGNRTGNGTGSQKSETLSARYMKEHFAYIRNAISENLHYPTRARRMGWSGRLAVEFVVSESGTVDRIRIAKSSGIPLLDSDAIETVRRSAPFPKPPVSARLIIPMEYTLQ